MLILKGYKANQAQFSKNETAKQHRYFFVKVVIINKIVATDCSIRIFQQGGHNGLGVSLHRFCFRYLPESLEMT